MNSKTVIGIIADDPAVRDALRSPLAKARLDVRLFDSPQAFFAAEALYATSCALIDVDMPKGNAYGFLAEIEERSLALPVIFITAHPNCRFCLQAERTAAQNCLQRPFDGEALLAAVCSALRYGDLDRLRHSERQEKRREIRARLATLTKREHDVFAALLKGLPNKVIAHELGISKKTVEVHRANLMMKMGARSLAELLRIGLTAGRAEHR